jgi:hypothetical protein
MIFPKIGSHRGSSQGHFFKMMPNKPGVGATRANSFFCSIDRKENRAAAKSGGQGMRTSGSSGI